MDEDTVETGDYTDANIQEQWSEDDQRIIDEYSGKVDSDG